MFDLSTDNLAPSWSYVARKIPGEISREYAEDYVNTDVVGP
jgi:hypothetical protein